MRKFTKGMLSAIVAFIVVAGMSSCEEDKIIGAEELPEAAHTFLTTYFPSSNITQAKKDRDGVFGKEFEVYLDDATKVEFDKNGEWVSVEGPDNQAIPTGFIEESIVSYVAENYPNAPISDISKERDGYEVELTNGMDLDFDANGTFLRID